MKFVPKQSDTCFYLNIHSYVYVHVSVHNFKIRQKYMKMIKLQEYAFLKLSCFKIIYISLFGYDAQNNLANSNKKFCYQLLGFKKAIRELVIKRVLSRLLGPN